jgi:hypothetical protein
MTQATINIAGIGPVEIKTDLRTVKLVGEISTFGDFVNVRLYKVLRNKRSAKEALSTRAWGCAYLTNIREEYFILTYL